MTKRPRRTPQGTQPPISATEPAKTISGTIITARPLGAAAIESTEPTPKIDPDEEHAVVVHLDDAWLERLDLPPE